MKFGRAAALLHAAVSAGVVAFQVALAAGAPWGAYAMGGMFLGQFPFALRMAALVLTLITPSVAERAIWAPVALLLLASSAMVAIEDLRRSEVPWRRGGVSARCRDTGRR